uniref:Uncharacterized protein n=1 Tax=Panagrolaimus sp. PS1159 TaxID=55785 RepID=A0AC35FTN3_9BILA
MEIIKKFIDKAYNPKNLLTTNTLTICGIYGIADIIAQLTDKNGIDFKRIVRVSSIGLLHGPMNHFWYKWLDRRLIISTIKPLPKVLIKKVAIDLSVSPVFTVTFIGGIAILEGHSIQKALNEYKNNFFKVLRLDLCVWPPSQLINFWFVPPRFRVLYVSMVILVYTCFLTIIRHSNISNELQKDKI